MEKRENPCALFKLLQSLKVELPYDPAILLLGIYQKKTKTLTQKDICTPMFIAALFTIVKTWKQLKCPLVDEVDKEIVVYIYSGILFSHIKEQTLPFATTWMDLKGLMLSEISRRKTNTI